MTPQPKTCYGGFPGKCSNVPGTPWTTYWCAECDEKRKKEISKSLKDMQAEFKKRTEGEST